MNTQHKTIDTTRFLIRSVCLLAALQIAILVVLFARESSIQKGADRLSAPSCLRGFGFNPKVPSSPKWDCKPAQINIGERA